MIPPAITSRLELYNGEVVMDACPDGYRIVEFQHDRQKLYYRLHVQTNRYVIFLGYNETGRPVTEPGVGCSYLHSFPAMERYVEDRRKKKDQPSTPANIPANRVNVNGNAAASTSAAALGDMPAHNVMDTKCAVCDNELSTNEDESNPFVRCRGCDESGHRNCMGLKRGVCSSCKEGEEDKDFPCTKKRKIDGALPGRRLEFNGEDQAEAIPEASAEAVPQSEAKARAEAARAEADALAKAAEAAEAEAAKGREAAATTEHEAAAAAAAAEEEADARAEREAAAAAAAAATEAVKKAELKAVVLAGKLAKAEITTAIAAAAAAAAAAARDVATSHAADIETKVQEVAHKDALLFQAEVTIAAKEAESTAAGAKAQVDAAKYANLRHEYDKTSSKLDRERQSNIELTKCIAAAAAVTTRNIAKLEVKVQEAAHKDALLLQAEVTIDDLSRQLENVRAAYNQLSALTS